MNIPKNNINLQNLSFSGHQKALDKTGYKEHRFYYMYDPDKYTCELELYSLDKDKKNNFSISTRIGTLPLKEASLKVSSQDFPSLDSDNGFAYRFKLTDKKGNVSYGFDNGSVIGAFGNTEVDKYNVVLNNRAIINKNGPMQLIMPDGYNPEKLNAALRGKALSSLTRTHANKLGGGFDGIIARLPQISAEGVKRIVGTPFTKDSISSHKYWTENAYRIAPDFGGEDGFKKLQVALAKSGINWIADAALVNEGLGGIHVGEMLRKGDESFSKNMFRAGERVSLGILPNKSNFARMKLINAPFVLDDGGKSIKNNTNYDSAKPTYIQFYDDRLVAEKDKTSDEIITTYANKNTDNIFDITKHDDAVYPYHIEVSPKELTRNAKRQMQIKGKVDLSDMQTIQGLTDFSTFNVVTKSEAAGIEVWDGNVDIPKLNFYRCNKDEERFIRLPEKLRQSAIEDFDRGTLAVRDYAITSGKYWTNLTNNIQLESFSKSIGQASEKSSDYFSIVNKLAAAKELPSSVSETIDSEVIKNVLDGEYHSRLVDDADFRNSINPEGYGNDYSLNDYILKKAMDLPLETVPVNSNLLGVLTSPYIAKKANTNGELGVSRYDLHKAGNPNLPDKYSRVYSKTEDIYTKQILPIISDVVSSLDVSKNGEVNDYGRYVLSEIVPDLTKYLLLKSLNPAAEVNVDNNGNFDFSKVDEEAISIQSLGIPYAGMTLDEEADKVTSIMARNLSGITEKEIGELKSKVAKRFESRSLEDFQIAEMVMDRTESGLGWRIDAAKDIASIDAVRGGYDDIYSTWDDVIDFWKRYNGAVLEENPHAYTTAEITDLADLCDDPAVQERKFIEQTGITSVANYNYFFSKLPNLFGPLFLEGPDGGWQSNEEKNFQLREKLDTGWCEGMPQENPGFLFQSPDDGVVNSYTFVGNHDKPRILHLFALDQQLYESDFASDNDKEIAARCLNKNVTDIDFDKVSSKAIAMADRLNSAFKSAGYNSADIKNSIAKLAQGEYKGKKFDADAFGTKPFEIVISAVLDEAERDGAKFENREKMEADVLKQILEPAYDRYFSVYKLMTVLPGSPTDFAGDKVGASGFETKAKNYHQQNRNIIHWDWLDNPNYDFIKQANDKLTDIASLRSNPKLSALNDGATITLPNRDNERLQSFLRYNDNSTVLVLTDNAGAKTPGQSKMNRNVKQYGTIDFSKFINPSDGDTEKQGLKFGIKAGTIFKNANSSDKSQYIVVNKDGKYDLVRRDESGRDIPISIAPEDFNTLVLYKAN